MYLWFWDFLWHIGHTGICSLPIDIERIARGPTNLKFLSWHAALPSLQAMRNHNGGLIACLSAYATLSNAFQLPALGPRWKYIAHISEAKCLGQTHREIKYTLCHLIWQLSFPSYWIEVVTCTAVGGIAVYSVCAVNADVFTNQVSHAGKCPLCDNATATLFTSAGGKKHNVAFITSSHKVQVSVSPSSNTCSVT